MKRIVVMQDISCLGKCSLTVILPVISAMGVECAVLPTAVLSTHTATDKSLFTVCFRKVKHRFSDMVVHLVYCIVKVTENKPHMHLR